MKSTSTKSASKFVVEKELASIPLEAGKSTIKIHTVSVDGESRIDFRKYVSGERYTGHTGSGFTLPATAVLAFQNAVAKIAKIAVAAKKTRKGK